LLVPHVFLCRLPRACTDRVVVVVFFSMSQQVMGQEAFREWEARKRIYLRHVKAKEVQTSQKWNRLAEQKDQEKRLRVRQMKRSILEYRRYLFFLWCLCSLVCVVNVGRTVCSGADL
jgi:hypothetical protein